MATDFPPLRGSKPAREPSVSGQSHKKEIFMFKVLLAASAVILIAFPVAALTDGNKLLRECNAAIRVFNGDRAPSSQDAIYASTCFGLMQGITNLNLAYQFKDKRNALFCLPKGGIKNGQAARIVVKYLRDYPEKLQGNESFLAIEALINAYPCTGKR
jgi:hypothetical protein